MAEYKCKAILLSKEESNHPKNFGYGYILENADRAIDMPFEIGDKVYDRACSLIVYNEKAYTIYRDFIDIGTGTRYYLCKESTLPYDSRPI